MKQLIWNSRTLAEQQTDLSFNLTAERFFRANKKHKCVDAINTHEAKRALETLTCLENE